MINAQGDVEYLKDRLVQQENLKSMIKRGDTEGWGEDFKLWTTDMEERLQLLKELITYKELYLKVEKELEEERGYL